MDKIVEINSYSIFETPVETVQM